MKKEPKKTIQIGSKKVDLKIDGTPNLRQLTKEQKVVVKNYVEKVKKAKKEVELKQLEELLKKTFQL